MDEGPLKIVKPKPYTGVAQLVEQWSPKPKVVSSNLTTRARNKIKANEQIEVLCFRVIR